MQCPHLMPYLSLAQGIGSPCLVLAGVLGPSVCKSPLRFPCFYPTSTPALPHVLAFLATARRPQLRNPTLPQARLIVSLVVDALTLAASGGPSGSRTTASMLQIMQCNASMCNMQSRILKLHASVQRAVHVSSCFTRPVERHSQYVSPNDAYTVACTE